jgi:hypothetical protein
MGWPVDTSMVSAIKEVGSLSVITRTGDGEAEKREEKRKTNNKIWIILKI